MAMGRPKAELVLSDEERSQLGAMARSRSLPAGLTQRAKILLACAEGETNREVSQRYAVTAATVGKWRHRFIEHRLQGLYDELRPGKPRTINDEAIATLINTTLQSQPGDGVR